MERHIRASKKAHRVDLRNPTQPEGLCRICLLRYRALSIIAPTISREGETASRDILRPTANCRKQRIWLEYESALARAVQFALDILLQSEGMSGSEKVYFAVLNHTISRL